MKNIKIVSWNVNGIRAIIKKNFINDINKLNADIMCLQETKASVEETKTALTILDEYQIYANSSKARKGYSGTAILTKIKPMLSTFQNTKMLDVIPRSIKSRYDGIVCYS